MTRNLFHRLIEQFINRSFFIKMFALFLMLIMIPALVLGIYLYRGASEEIRSEIYGAHTRSLEFVRDNVDSQLVGIEVEALQLSMNPYLNKVISGTISKEEKLLLLGNIKDILQVVTHTKNFIRSAGVYVREDDIFLRTSNDGLNFPSGTDSYIQDFIQSNKHSDHLIRGADGNYPGGTKTLTLLRSIPAVGQECKAVVVFDLDLNSLEQALEKNKFLNTMELLVAAQDQALAFGSPGLSPAVRNDILHLGKLEGYRNSLVKLDGKPYILSSAKSQTGFSYMAIVPRSYLQSRLLPLKLTVTLACMLLAAAGILFSFWMSKRFYNPIQHMLNLIRNEMGRGDESTDQKGNVFHHISLAFHEALNSGKHARKIVKDNKVAIRTSLLKELLNGGRYDEQELQQQMKDLGIDFVCDGFAVLLIGIDSTYDTDDAEDRMDRDYPDRYAVIKLAEESVNAEGLSLTAIDWDRDKLCIIANFHDQDPNADMLLMDASDRIRKLVERHLHFTVSIGVGCEVSGWKQLSMSMEKAKIALNYKLIAGKNKVISYKDAVMDDQSVYFYPLVEIEKIIVNLKLGNKDEVAALLDEMFDKISEKQGLSVGNARYILIQLVSLTVKEMLEEGLDLNSILTPGFNLFEELDRKETILEIREWIHPLFEAFVSAFDQRKNRSSMTQAALDYIMENYQKQIALTDLAGMLGVSPQHFSRKFKEEIGENYVAYFNKVRLREGEKLLAAGNMSIYEVAEKVGFNDYKYFIKRFSELYGVTPAKYRDNLLNKS